MAFISEQPRSSSALAVTITREIHISSEKHERQTSMVDSMSPGNGGVQIEKQKQSRWKANPHPDNIVLPRKLQTNKKQLKNKAVDPVELTRRLNDIREMKIQENGGPKPELREMDWEKLRRQPRIDHSRAGSKLEIRKEPQPIRSPEQHNYFTGPRPAPPLPRTEESIEQYPAEIYAAHSQFTPRTESASTGVYQHSQFKSTPLRKDSDATGTDVCTESLNRGESIDSSEPSRTSSRGTGAAARIKSFRGLPPLAFQTQSDEHFNSETTLSLESTFEKLERVLTDTSSISNSARSITGTIASSSSVAGTSGRDTLGDKSADAPTFDTTTFDTAEQNNSKKNSTMTNSTITTSNRTTTTTTTDSSGETIPFVMRRSALPQGSLPELPELSQQSSQQNIHPLLRLPTATSEEEQDAPPLPPKSPLRQLPLPILTLTDVPSQQPPFPLKGRASFESFEPTSDRDRALQVHRPATSRSLSSNNTHRPIQEEVSYSYWRLSRPESWASEDEENRDAPRKMSSASMPQQQPGAVKGVFGVFGKVFRGSRNSTKSIIEQPAKRNELHRASTAQDYNIPGVLPHDFPTQRKNFLAAFTEQPAKRSSRIKASVNRPTNELHKPFTMQDLGEEKHYNLPGVLPDDFPMQRKNFLGAFNSKR